MFLHKLNLEPFFAPTDVGGSTSSVNTGTGGTLGEPGRTDDKDDVIKFLAEDDKPEDDKIDLEDKPKKAKDDKFKSKAEDDKSEDDEEEKELSEEDDEENEDDDEEESEDDELEDLLDETEEPEADKLELSTPIRKKEILKKYPNLFKDFPYLETAYYREQAFTQILPTIDDAKEAVQSRDILNAFEADVKKGDTEKLFTGLKNSSDESFKKAIDNLLPTIAKVDKDAYLHLTGNITKMTIIGMINEAKTSGNETLQAAAVILNQYVFGSSNFTPMSTLAKNESAKDNSEEVKLSREREEFRKEKYNDAKSNVDTKFQNSLKATIEANMDPKDSMGAYVKKQAVREATEKVKDLMEKDTRFKTILKQLWDFAEKSRYSPDSLKRIETAWKSKARPLLQTVIKQTRNEALRGIGKRVKEEKDEPTDKKLKANGLSSTTNRGHKPTAGSSKKDIPAGITSYDYLMQD